MSFLLMATLPLLVAARPDSTEWKERTLKSAAASIDRANDEWTRAIVTGDADVLSAPYASDGIFIARNGTVVHGREAVRVMYARRPPGVKVVKATIKSDGRAAHDSDDVYEWGTAHMTLKRGKNLHETTARYLTVWHRDGKRWLISRNIAF
jgi:ketosteroid isomerase-like protein